MVEPGIKRRPLEEVSAATGSNGVIVECSGENLGVKRARLAEVASGVDLGKGNATESRADGAAIENGTDQEWYTGVSARQPPPPPTAALSANDNVFITTLRQSNIMLVGSASPPHDASSCALAFECDDVTRSIVRLNRVLDADPDLSEHVLSGMEDFVSQFPEDTGPNSIAGDERAVHLLLTPVRFPARGGRGSSLDHCYKQQLHERDCVIKMLLNVRNLQAQVVELLLQWVTERAHESIAADASLREDLPRLLLHQLRFLNFVEDGESHARLLMEALTFSFALGGDSRLSQEILNLLPEVLDDTHHGFVVEQLQQQLENDARTLSAPIIECLAQLRIPDNLLVDIRASVLGILGSAPLTDLPVAIRFVLESLSQGDDIISKQQRAKVMKELRQRLTQISTEDIEADAALEVSIGIMAEESDDNEESWGSKHARAAAAKRSTDSTCIQAILKMLHSCVLMRPDLAKEYFASLSEQQGQSTSGEVPKASVIDFWVLVLLRGSAIHAKSATQRIKSLISKTSEIDEKLVRNAVLGQSAVLGFMFPQLLELAGTLMGAISVSLKEKMDGGGMRRHREIGASLYQAMFVEFDEPFFRQEVVVALVMHCGVSVEEDAELEVALQCLDRIVALEENVRAMEPFVEFVKTLAHNCHQMLPAHTRIVFSVLSKFVVKSRADEEEDNANWFHIMLKKLLTSSSDACRAAGAAGAVQYIKASLLTKPSRVTKAIDDGGGDSQGSSQSNNIFDADDDVMFMCNGSGDGDSNNEDESHASWKDSFDLALSACRSSSRAMMAFYEELAEIIREQQEQQQHSSFSKKLSRQGLRKWKTAVAYMDESLSEDFNARFIHEIAGSFSSSSSSSTVSLDTKRVPCGDLEGRYLYNLNGGDASLALNLLPSLTAGGNDPRLRERFLYMCSALRCKVLFEDILFDVDDAASVASAASFRCSQLLGCPLILPDDSSVDEYFPVNGIIDDNDDENNNLEVVHVRTAILLSLFHSINWVREVINCFASYVTSEPNSTAAKVFMRFNQLGSLEQQLEEVVLRHGSTSYLHALPLGNCSGSHKQTCELGGSDRNKLSSGAKVAASVSQAGKKSNKFKKVNLTSGAEKEVLLLLRSGYRPFCPAVLGILERPALLLKQRTPVAARSLLRYLKDEITATLNPKRASLNSNSNIACKKRIGLNSNNPAELFRVRVPPGRLLRQLGTLLPHVRRVIDALAGDLMEMRKTVGFADPCEGEDTREENLRLDSLSAMCGALRALLKSNIVRSGSKSLRASRTIALIGFASKAKAGKVADDGNNDNDDDDGDALTRADAYQAIFKMLMGWLEKNAAAGSTLRCEIIDLMVELVTFAKNPNLLCEVSDYCHKILVVEEHAMPKQAVGRLLGLHLSLHEDPLTRTEEVIEEITTVAVSEARDCVGDCYCALSKNNLAHYFEPVLKVLSELLVDANFQQCMPATTSRKKKQAKKSKGKQKARVRTESDDDSTSTSTNSNSISGEDCDSNESEDDKSNGSESAALHGSGADSNAIASTSDNALKAFHTANKAASLAEKLILLTRKCSENKKVLAVVVKQGRVFVETFIKNAVPFLTAYFRKDEAGVQGCLKHVQKSSRQLQAICEFGKASKDASMMSAVPKLRRLFENLTYSARAIYSANNRIGLFSTGSLKRRGVDGSLIAEGSTEDEQQD